MANKELSHLSGVSIDNLGGFGLASRSGNTIVDWWARDAIAASIDDPLVR